MAEPLDASISIHLEQEETLTITEEMLGAKPYVLIESGVGFKEYEVKVAGLAGATPTQMANYLRIVSDILVRTVAALPEDISEGGNFTA